MPTDLQITERIICDIEDARCNPVALYWMKKLGGWDMWVFSGTQTEGIEVRDGESFEKFIADLADTNKRKQIISKTEIPKIVLGYESLPTAKVRGIKGILSSIKVLMLTSGVNELPPTFIEVNVEPGSFKIIETENDFHNLEFTIELIGIYNQEL